MPYKDPQKRKAYNNEYQRNRYAVYGDSHKEELKKKQRDYYAKNRDKVKAAIKAWKKANPEKMEAQRKRQDEKRRGQLRDKNKNK